MKTKMLLLLASLVTLTTVSRAAQTDTEVVVLPTYIVEVARYTPAEKQIQANLDELRQQTKVTVDFPVVCAALKAIASEDSVVAQKARTDRAPRVAKL